MAAGKSARKVIMKERNTTLETTDHNNRDNSENIKETPDERIPGKLIGAIVAVGSGPTKLNCYTIGAGAVDFDKADFYAFSSRRTVVYYAVGATLHAYDYNKGNERHYTFDIDRKSTRLNSSHTRPSRMPSSA